MKTRKTVRPAAWPAGPRRKLAAFRLPPATLVRLRQMSRRNQLSQSKVLEALIHTATL